MTDGTVVDMEQTISNLTLNQEGLTKDNNALRKQLTDLRNEKAGPLIFRKMLAVKADIGAVGKDQKNTGQGWNFRGIDQFMNALHPILNKHGVGIFTTTRQAAEAKFVKNEKTGKSSKNTAIIMEYTFFAEDGSSIASSTPAEGVDPGDKGTNKALSAAFKYALMQTFCIPTQDMEEGDKGNATVDGEGKAPAKKTKVTKASASDATKTTKKSFRKRVADPEPESKAGEL